ncbi:hypothetical protein SAMN05216191_12725 [Paenibacillus jilunlii]|uniref:MmyB-like transcription regulator ligand binding domain-containing protein n=1 Tax=Paenibacillus jilunlii TaxID=682956 RepID=A0A1G9YND7_9BACL|nr:hypothetical protein SAMN05216191_12725 [Paenibacillus jilunlii]
MHTKNTRLQQLLYMIEQFRIARQREISLGKYMPWKRFTQQELNDEACATYKNLLVGRSLRIPDRNRILTIADYLELSSDGRNDLLLAAGYLPIQTEISGNALEQAIGQAQHTMNVLPFPAMIVTHTEDIKGYNESFHRLFGFPESHAYDHLMNRIDLHFNPDLPVYLRSTFDRSSFEKWKTHAVQGIRLFKKNHILSRYDDWYQRVLNRLERYLPEEQWLEDALATGDIDNGELTQTILTRSESNGELIPIQYKQLSITTGSLMAPKVQVFLPVDDAARRIFEELGCHVNEEQK